MSLDTLLKEKSLYHYILDNSLKPSSIQKEMLEHAKKASYSEMNTAPEQVQFLALLIKMLNAHKILELGVFRGIGTLGMAKALPNDGKIYACDITDEYLEEYSHYWADENVSNKIDLRIAPATDTLNHLIQSGHQNSFDFAYIDADKENYPQYYELTYTLLRQGGVMVFDNMLMSGKVLDHINQSSAIKAVHELNMIIHEDSRVDASLLPVGDGIYIVRKN